MTNEAFFKIQQIGETANQSKPFWWNFGAVFGFAGGAINLLVAIALTLIMFGFSKDPDHDSLQMVTNFFFYSVFPMLFWGANCLDKVDEFQKNKSNENQNEYQK